tara:strand:- start:253 stop:1140 length:888 start_codon:yes stop_codon:yes gene_type:complete
MKYQGSYCALITPFKNNVIDKQSLKKIIEWHIKNKTKGIIPCGTTGESPTLSHNEHKLVVELAVEYAKGKMQVIAGTGSNSTEEAVELTKHAKKVGADSALVVVPYYNKPSQEGLYKHYLEIANRANFPIFIYNIPGRSIVDISDNVIAKLAKNKYIIGIKDASNDLSRPHNLRSLITHKHFYQLSGEDGTQLAFLSEGGDGVISVSANIVPNLIADLHKAWFEKNYTRAFQINNNLQNLNKYLFLESNPCPVKYAAYKIGLCEYEIRLPLTKISKNTEKLLNKAIKKLVKKTRR